jgi:hypothetical protein
LEKNGPKYIGGGGGKSQQKQGTKRGRKESTSGFMSITENGRRRMETWAVNNVEILRWLSNSLANSHDHPKLEQLGAWEPLDNLGPLLNGKVEETWRFVSFRNKM